jgi:hypothetical protein
MSVQGRTSARQPAAAMTNIASGILQRKCACGTHTIAGGECTSCQKEKSSGQLQRSSNHSDLPNEVPPIVHEVLGSSGQPLDAHTRSFFEPRFNHDFSHVRLHTDTKAESSASAVNALAYTVGHDVVFAAGRYAPGTRKGDHLIAHELTHVLQQGLSTRAVQPKLSIGNANEVAEREADERACSVVHGTAPATIATVGGGEVVLQRAETDTSAGCETLKDTQSDVNEKINQVMTNARTAFGTSAAAVVKGLYDELGENKGLGRTGIEVWVKTLDETKIKQPKKSETKYEGVTFMLWAQPFPILNPTMRINNICVGSDKLGHFLQQGFDYYKIAHLKPGGTTKEAEEFGAESEATGYGLKTTGVYSNADLEANRQGLRFYEELTAKPSLKFDIAQYINERWNEEVNPSHYRASVGKTVWHNLLNGSWSGVLDAGSGAKSKVTANLTVDSDDITVTGKFGYVLSGGQVIEGTITGGQITHQKNSLGAVTGVQIDFNWEAGLSSGKAQWTSKNESNLQGTWGKDASANDSGAWEIIRSRTPLTLPVPVAPVLSPCEKACEEAFNRCLMGSASGGMACIAQRNFCLMNCKK